MTPQEASKIQVSAGRDLTGMDMILAEAEAYSVSGRAVGPDGKPFANALYPCGSISLGGHYLR